MATLTRPTKYKDYVHFLDSYNKTPKNLEKSDSGISMQSASSSSSSSTNSDVVDFSKNKNATPKSFNNYLKTISKNNNFNNVNNEKVTQRSEIFIEIHDSKPKIASKPIALKTTASPPITSCNTPTVITQSRFSPITSAPMSPPPPPPFSPIKNTPTFITNSRFSPITNAPLSPPPPPSFLSHPAPMTNAPLAPPLPIPTHPAPIRNGPRSSNTPLAPPPPPIPAVSVVPVQPSFQGPPIRIHAQPQKGNTIDRNDPMVRKLVYGTLRGMYGACHDKANHIVSTLPRNRVKKDNEVQRIIQEMASNGDLDKIKGRATKKVEE